MKETAQYWSASNYKIESKCGKRVRSKGECEIADFLYDQKIKFIYEPFICVEGLWRRPDFYLLDYNIFIEYFGWEDDALYDENRRKKQKAFHDNHFNLISLYPHQLGSLGAVIRAAFNEMMHISFPQKENFDWRIIRKSH